MSKEDKKMADSVIDIANIILVSREGNNFKVETLSSEEEKILNGSEFQDSTYKYPGAFIRRFCQAVNFPEATANVQLNSEAKDYMMELIDFNRIDS